MHQINRWQSHHCSHEELPALRLARYNCTTLKAYPGLPAQQKQRRPSCRAALGARLGKAASWLPTSICALDRLLEAVAGNDLVLGNLNLSP